MRTSPATALLAVAGAALMPVSLFLDWYEVDTGDGTIAIDGWDVFESTDALMALAAIVTVALVVRRPPFAGRALLVVGALTTGWIVVQMVDRPGALGFTGRADLSLQIGAWAGLFGALLIVVAGVVSPASAPETAPDREGAGS